MQADKVAAAIHKGPDVAAPGPFGANRRTCNVTVIPLATSRRFATAKSAGC
jgi:hypothetical protein